MQGKTSVKKDQLRRIHIEPAKDGTAIGHVHMHVTEGKNKGPWLQDASEEPNTYSSPEEAGKHVTELLRQHFAKAAPKVTDQAARRKSLTDARNTGKEQAFPSDDGPPATQG